MALDTLLRVDVETTKQTFEQFLAQRRIKPFELTYKIFSDKHVDHVISLMMNGYDQALPITKAESDIEELNNEIIDGRHRLRGLFLMQKKGWKIPDQIPTRTEVITDADHLKARRDFYDMRNQSKPKEIADARVQKDLTESMEKNMERSIDEWIGYWATRGFPYQQPILKAFNKLHKVKAELPQQKKHVRITIGGIEMTGLDNMNIGHTEDEGTQFFYTCDSCKTKRIFLIKDESVVKIYNTNKEEITK